MKTITHTSIRTLNNQMTNTVSLNTVCRVEVDGETWYGSTVDILGPEANAVAKLARSNESG